MNYIEFNKNTVIGHVDDVVYLEAFAYNVEDNKVPVAVIVVIVVAVVGIGVAAGVFFYQRNRRNYV